MRKEVRQLPSEMLSLLEVSPYAESCPALPDPPTPPIQGEEDPIRPVPGVQEPPPHWTQPLQHPTFPMAQGWEKGRGLLIPTLWLGYLSLGNPRGEAGKGSHGVAERTHPNPPQAMPPQLHLQTPQLRKQEREGRQMARGQLASPCCMEVAPGTLPVGRHSSG